MRLQLPVTAAIFNLFREDSQTFQKLFSCCRAACKTKTQCKWNKVENHLLFKAIKTLTFERVEEKI